MFKYLSTFVCGCACECVCLTYVIRIQPVGLVERIQAIAQNMSEMAVRVEQILQRSMANYKGMMLTHARQIPQISLHVH